MPFQILAIFCAIGLAIGQIMFKASAVSISETGSFFAPKSAVTLLSALTLYAFISIVWVWVLQKVELGKVYPLMALAFIFVPLGSHFVFGEDFKPMYFVGVFFILIGIVLVVRS